MRSRPRRREVVPLDIPIGGITAITPSLKAAGRFDLIVDGTPVARLSIDGIERLRLQVGRDINESEVATIGAEAEASRTYDRAIAMLAARGRASGELRRLLVRKGEVPQTVDLVVARLTTAGFLDDSAFAREFTRYRAGSGLSRRRIERELRRRGIERTTATAAIEETFAEEGVDEMAAIETAARKKLRTMSLLDGPTTRGRLYGFLARRGFDADAINLIVRRLTNEPIDDA